MSLLAPHANYQCIGHAQIEQHFLDAWARGTMPHSLMFCGAKGIGKATFAYRLIRYVLSGGSGDNVLFGPTDLSVAPESPICRRIEAGSHGDLLVLTPDDSTATPTIKVEATRKIGEFLSLTPSESPWRVVLIDAADDMNPNAANALLKVLEEPPSYCIIILISHNPGKLLPTIRSRCRKIDFQPHETHHFEQILALGDTKLDAATTASLHALSHGSPGLALYLHEHGALELYADLIDIFQQYPTIHQPSLNALLKKVAATKNNDAWGVWRQMWDLWLYRLSLCGLNMLESPLVDTETEVLSRMSAHHSFGHWQRLKQRSNGWFTDTETLHLDRKQVIHSLISAATAG